MKLPLKVYAYNNIRENIIYGIYEPGSILNEEALTEEFNVSRTPIRDAIGRLEQEGLVSIIPKQGILVTELNEDDISQVFEFRLLLEPYAIKTYGHTIPVKTFTKFYKIFQKKIVEHQFKEDDEFHSLFINASRNKYLIETYQKLSSINQRLRILSGNFSHQRIQDTQQEHLRIVQSCIYGNWEEAANFCKEHLLIAKIAAQKVILDGSFITNKSSDINNDDK